jgi:hypothetical protein
MSYKNRLSRLEYDHALSQSRLYKLVAHVAAHYPVTWEWKASQRHGEGDNTVSVHLSDDQGLCQTHAFCLAWTTWAMEEELHDMAAALTHMQHVLVQTALANRAKRRK